MKSLRHHLSIVLTVFAFTGCAAIGGSSDIFSMGGSSAGGATTSDDTTDTTGGTELMPSVPIASTESFLISDTNSSSSSQLLATGLDASYSLLVSTAGSMNANPSLGYAHLSPLLGALINQTLQPIHLIYDYYQLKTGQLSAGVFFARHINPPVTSAFINSAHASATTCSGTVIPISADGTVSYELPDVAAGMSYSIQYVNTAEAAAGDCSTVGEAIYESPVSAVQFVAGDAASSNAVAFDGTDSACSVITDASTATNIMQEIAYTTDSGFEVASTTAEHTTCAVDATLISDGLEIDFNSSAVLSVRDATTVRSTQGHSSASDCDFTDMCSPVRMKSKDDIEYYSTEYAGVAGNDQGYIYQLNNTNHILFLPSSSYNLQQTLAYDVDDSQTALVVFETVSGETMVATKTINALYLLFVDRVTPFNETNNNFAGTLDLWIYNSSASDDSADGSAVVLKSDSLMQVTYDAIGANVTSTSTDPCAGMDEEEIEVAGIDCTAVVTTSTIGDGQSVAVTATLALSHTASAMVISDDKAQVYILNTDSSVTIVDPTTLTETAGPASYDADANGTITADEMKTALGYDFDYALASIKYVTTDDGAGGSNHYLLLGANGLDSVLTISLE